MNEVSVISLIPFFVFLALLLLQSLLPRRAPQAGGSARMLHNLLLFVVNIALLRFLIPLTLLGVSSWAIENQFGLLNIVSLPLPTIVTVVACVIALDFSIYWQHVATHKFPILWRMHKVHHADRNMDVTTAIRFHPLELLLSLVYKSLLVALLGVPVAAVIMFELLLFIGPAFNHSNLVLPSGLDRRLRWFVATPDTHRAHHSTIIAEQDTNYGFFLIWWDKLFGTYTQTPSGGHMNMSIGLLAEGDQCERVDQMLLAPFK